MSEATAGVFRHAAVQNIFGNTGERALMWKLCLYLDFLTDFLVDIYEIFNTNNSSDFDLENYSSLVDVKLTRRLLK